MRESSVYACDVGEQWGKNPLHVKASAVIKDPQKEDGPRGARGGQGGGGGNIKGQESKQETANLRGRAKTGGGDADCCEDEKYGAKWGDQAG